MTDISGNIYQRMVEEIEDYAIILLNCDGIIQNWNRGAQKIKGYTATEAIGKSFTMFYLPEDRASGLPQVLLRQAGAAGRAIHEGWRLRKDGKRFWGSTTLTAIHDSSGTVIGFSKVTHDLTEKKMADDRMAHTASELRKANNSLRKSEERFQRMVREVRDYAIILLDEKGNILNWNAGAEKIKGYTASEVIGLNFRIFYLPADQERGLPEQLIHMAEKEGRAVHEGWRLRKDGTAFWGSIVITALHNEEGSLIGFSKVTRDLTERKQAEDKLQEYLLTLEQQNRRLEQFAYVASHDLQEPLRKIRTFTDIIRIHRGNGEMVEKYFERIDASAHRMSELVASVLQYSRLEMATFETVDLDRVLDLAKEELVLPIEERNAVIEADTLPLISGIPIQLQQLFVNLLGNAIKFAEGQPIIRINVAEVQSREIPGAPASLKAGPCYAISFRDNGIGFDQQYAGQIFSMFQRLHPKHEYGGTGIGLSICKRIMENHGGFIRAESEEGSGSTFWIYFPYSD
ncbi:PAS domain S-box protein [Flavihumibacter petaseus]|uniref:histidine kinase n=1 Tax=Flavihumibacter petaseus NBRC 106054 TaxID=1220578 RepID=A0A0E9N1X7_9BACT|nr:PAS domain S-box protein [Flavihumibacter petaseus]GAO43854.1 putative two-component histidine kinase [Flavihumibacter petaseus NBRC 106054]